MWFHLQCLLQVTIISCFKMILNFDKGYMAVMPVVTC